MDKFKFKNVVIIGGNGAIGNAFVNNLISKDEVKNIFVFSRSSQTYKNPKIKTSSINLINENSIKEASIVSSSKGPLDLVILSTGILHNNIVIPEKSLKELSHKKMLEVFLVNTFGPAIVFKYFLPLLTKDKTSVFAALSARVGSISDNQLGGWYSYRASKAALNMMIKTASIEIRRKNQNSILIGLHPGTVKSRLSKPFQKNIEKSKLFSPEYSASKLLDIINNLNLDDTGNIIAWDGKKIEA